MDWSHCVGWMECIRAFWSTEEKIDWAARVPLLGKIPPIPEGCRSDNWSAIHLFCLGGSIALFPYIGKEGLLKDKVFSDSYRNTVAILLMVWWCLVAFGVTCSLFGRSSVEFHYARLSAYLGVFGTSALVIMFLHWALVIDAMWTVYCLLAVAGLIFFVHWIWV